MHGASSQRPSSAAVLGANFVPSYLQVLDAIPKTASENPQERFLFERFAPDAPGVFREDAH